MYVDEIICQFWGSEKFTIQYMFVPDVGSLYNVYIHVFQRPSFFDFGRNIICYNFAYCLVTCFPYRVLFTHQVC